MNKMGPYFALVDPIGSGNRGRVVMVGKDENTSGPRAFGMRLT
jgi:hypothetical protein